MLRPLAAVVAVLAVAVPAAAASNDTGFAFGRSGGNIRPFWVVIRTDGVVRVSKPAEVRRTKLSRLQLGELNRLAAISRFGALPASTRCPGTLPDVAETFIRVGPSTVRVHGTCEPEYQHLWKALARAVRLSG